MRTTCAICRPTDTKNNRRWEAKPYKIYLNEFIGFKPIVGISSKFKPIIKDFKFTNSLNVNYGISGIKII